MGARIYSGTLSQYSFIIQESIHEIKCNIARKKVFVFVQLYTKKSVKHIDITRIKVYYIITARGKAQSESGRSKRKLNQERHIRAERDKGD